MAIDHVLRIYTAAVVVATAVVLLEAPPLARFVGAASIAALISTAIRPASPRFQGFAVALSALFWIARPLGDGSTAAGERAAIVAGLVAVYVAAMTARNLKAEGEARELRTRLLSARNGELSQLIGDMTPDATS